MMRIFDIFKKKENKKKEEKLTDTIILMMTQYLLKLQSETVSSKSVSDLRKEYERLERIGLCNTGNARKIKDKLDFIQKEKDSRSLGQILLDYIKIIHNVFGVTTYLISEEQFIELVRKYKLDLRHISKLTIDISEDNIEILESIAKSATQDNLLVNRLNANICNNDRIFFIDQINDRRSSSRNDSMAFRIIQEQHLDLVVYNPGRYEDPTAEELNYEKVNSQNDWMMHLEYSSLIDLHGKYLGPGDFMVAAKTSCFNEENPVLQGNPLIYQVCPYGVLIHLIIGEEADQGILDEYKKLSNDLLG